MPTIEPALIVALVVVLLAVIVLIKAVRIVPQARRATSSGWVATTARSTWG